MQKMSMIITLLTIISFTAFADSYPTPSKFENSVIELSKLEMKLFNSSEGELPNYFNAAFSVIAETYLKNDFPELSPQQIACVVQELKIEKQSNPQNYEIMWWVGSLVFVDEMIEVIFKRFNSQSLETYASKITSVLESRSMTTKGLLARTDELYAKCILTK